MHFFRSLLALSTAVLVNHIVCAQDTTQSRNNTTNLMNQLETQQQKNTVRYATSIFNYTHVIDGQSVESLPAHVLDVRILHRFGPISSGIYNYFGLDYAPFNIKIGFEYGLTNNLMIGVAHSGYNKTYDGFAKLRLSRQSSGDKEMPVSVSIVPTVAINTLKASQIDPVLKPDSGASANRASYVVQLLIARKFSEGFAMQLMPTYVHADKISHFHTNYNMFAIGIAARERISKRINVNVEYYYQVQDLKADGTHNVFSFGFDINTGGHVFEILFSNSFALTEKSFITETTGSWNHGDELFGFNISRVFQLGEKHK